MKLLFRYLIFIGVPYVIATRIEKYFGNMQILN